MDKYAVIGNPVEHSLSPLILQAFAKQTGKSFEYTTIKPPLDGFVSAVRRFQGEGGKGLNVTLPFKREAYHLADQRSAAAKMAQAASVLKFNSDGSIFADNFDGHGLVQDLKVNHHITLAQKNILILGAGGSVRGIIAALIKESPKKILIANRTENRAIELAQDFKPTSHVDGTGLNQLEAKFYDIIIHATSMGHQQSVLNLPNGLMTEHTCCYDISYGKAATHFLNWAKLQGAQLCFDGIGMLVEHNAAAFYLWFGIHPQTKSVIEQIFRDYP